MEVKAKTWSRDSHALFDYEASNLVKSTARTTGSSKLLRIGNKCEFAFGDVPEACEVLLHISERNSIRHTDEYSVRPSPNEKLWLVVKNLPEGKGCRLVEGDVIKIGRVMFRVKQLSPDGEARPTFPSLSSALEVEVYNGETAEQPLACRICLSDVQSRANPLISPCKCSGTMKFIHLECLQEWLKSRLNLKLSGSATSYFWRTLDCELCKEDFPTTVQVSSEIRDLVEVHKPNSPFIVLEDIKREHSNRGLHVVSMSEGNSFKLGRGHECDIRVSDISVSRMHAEIRLKDGGFFLVDKDSKFGTLVQARRVMHLVPGLTVSLQISRTVLSLKVKQPWGLFQCCRCFQNTAQVAAAPEKCRNEDRESSAEEKHISDQRDHPEALENTDHFREISEVRELSEGLARMAVDAGPMEEEKVEELPDTLRT